MKQKTTHFCDDIKNKIIPNGLILDTRVWDHSKFKKLEFKDVYNSVPISLVRVSWGKSIWSHCIPLAKYLCLWRILHNGVANDDNLRKRGWIII